MGDEVVVVGGGIAGLSSALFLAEAGYRVALHDYRDMSYNPSSRASGVLDFQMPPPFIDWAIRTYRIYRRMPRSDLGLSPVGSLIVSKDKECLGRIREWMMSRGLEARFEDAGLAGDLRDLTGVDVYVRDDEHLLYTFEVQVDVGWVMGSFLGKLESMGVNVRYGSRVNISGDRVWAGGAEVRGDVIIAGGPWTPGLIEGLRGKVLIYRCQASHIVGPEVKLILVDEPGDYYIAPAPGGFIIGDGSNMPLEDPEDGYIPDMEEPYMLLERASRRIAGASESYPQATWSAPCIASLDMYPLAGMIDEGLYVITGFNGVGISIAPAVAEMLAEYIRGVRRDMGPLDPYRSMPKAYGLPEPFRVCNS